jgi:hypothetical protein
MQRTEKPIIAGFFREPADIGLQNAGIARADRPLRFSAKTRTAAIRRSTEPGTPLNLLKSVT